MVGDLRWDVALSGSNDVHAAKLCNKTCNDSSREETTRGLPTRPPPPCARRCTCTSTESRNEPSRLPASGTAPSPITAQRGRRHDIGSTVTLCHPFPPLRMPPLNAGRWREARGPARWVSSGGGWLISTSAVQSAVVMRNTKTQIVQVVRPQSCEPRSWRDHHRPNNTQASPGACARTAMQLPDASSCSCFRGWSTTSSKSLEVRTGPPKGVHAGKDFQIVLTTYRHATDDDPGRSEIRN